MLVGSTMVIKPVEGVIRPVISSLIPKLINRRGLILDVGLNVDAKPEVLAQYALLGSIYAQSVMGIENPRVALLNIGEEEGKGNAQAKATFDLLKADKRINFVGNVESSYIFTGTYGGPDPDVVVADGFVGNTVLKMAEALYRINFKLSGGKPRVMNFLRPVLGRLVPKLYYQQDFWEQMNYESIGGTPVIGINAPVMIGHGGSSARAISSMILSMEREIKGKFPEKLRAALAEK